MCFKEKGGKEGAVFPAQDQGKYPSLLVRVAALPPSTDAGKAATLCETLLFEEWMTRGIYPLRPPGGSPFPLLPPLLAGL